MLARTVREPIHQEEGRYLIQFDDDPHPESYSNEYVQEFNERVERMRTNGICMPPLQNFHPI